MHPPGKIMLSGWASIGIWERDPILPLTYHLPRVEERGGISVEPIDGPRTRGKVSRKG
jgi:hypothetical protein